MPGQDPESQADLRSGSLPIAPQQGDLLWSPSSARVERSNLFRYKAWLESRRGLCFESYEALWDWSVTDVDAFWASIWDYFAVDAVQKYNTILSGPEMPGAIWFEGARLNFCQHLLRHESVNPDRVVIHAFSESGVHREVTWTQLGESVRRMATALRNLGIVPGDRIVSYLPNIPETAIAMMAATAIGAVWASAAPEFGSKTVIDRFAQLDPKLIFVTDGYTFAGADKDRSDQVAQIVEGLPSLDHVVHVPYNQEVRLTFSGVSAHTWRDLIDTNAPTRERFEFEQVAHDHPLWVLFSSGTTGLPKAIIHSHAGMLLEQLRAQHFCAELTPDSTIFFYTTTSWMVWNSLYSALVTGASVVIYDGNPLYPDSSKLWRITEASRATVLGLSPSLVVKMDQDGVQPGRDFDVSALEMVILGGAPSTPQTFAWFYNHVKPDLWVTSQSGGTEICSAITGAVSLLPVHAGEMQGRVLGIHVEAWNERGESVRNEVAELVICAPFPSMPLGFWNDPGDQRYFESYFEDFPNAWRQGDLFMINDRGGCYIFGRSDATLNRHGIRIGTSEIYRTLEQMPEIDDAMVVAPTLQDGPQMLLFVTLRANAALTSAMDEMICRRLREDNSPRHVPDRIIKVPSIPYTITGKRLEVPVRRILEGTPVDQVANPDLMRDPGTLNWYLEYADHMRLGIR
ncbi:acetoacetate--CoA ligase [Hyphomonas chukchiensis]|uniref:acetoacetate--CoA ligase n=1 Tax=Hyphomonas chukchiensis TaxID=1280947 RepID=UPI0009E02226|nr:acetoacetate--CoA ligase [Hyphomonas chukchiensis]